VQARNRAIRLAIGTSLEYAQKAIPPSCSALPPRCKGARASELDLGTMDLTGQGFMAHRTGWRALAGEHRTTGLVVAIMARGTANRHLVREHGTNHAQIFGPGS
jgi:hypothetical protein